MSLKIEYDAEKPWLMSERTLSKVESNFVNGKDALDSLMKKFISTLANDFAFYGDEVIENIRKESPIAYARLITSLFPRQAEVKQTGGPTTQVNMAVQVIDSRIQELLQLGTDKT